MRTNRPHRVSLIAGLAGALVGCSASSPGGDDDPAPNGDGGFSGRVCADGLGDWTGTDDVRPSQDPPCGLAPAEVPLFVGIGWDDNGSAEGMDWAVGMLQDRQAHATFYMTSTYGAQDNIKQ